MIREMTVRELAKRLENGHAIHLLDVRQPEEHALVALPGSTLIPLRELQARVGELRPPQGATVVVYCHHGVRSLHGAAILAHAGIENVFSLAGGIDAWSVLVDPEVPRY